MLGTRFIGQVNSRMLEHIANLSEGAAPITSIFSTDQESAQKVASRWPKARAAESAEELIADPAVDAVCVCDSLGPLPVQRAGEESESTVSRGQVAQRFLAILMREFPHLAPLHTIAGVPNAVVDANFIAAVSGAVEPYPPLKAGVQAQAVVEAAYRSARDRRTIAIEHL